LNDFVSHCAATYKRQRCSATNTPSASKKVVFRLRIWQKASEKYIEIKKNYVTAELVIPMNALLVKNNGRTTIFLVSVSNGANGAKLFECKKSELPF
jgi:hypothetical protein